VDATFGAGGHASLLAADLQGRGKLIAIDRDPGARVYFDRLAKRAECRRGFSAATSRSSWTARRATTSRPMRFLLDLGVSSMQIDRPERGFSYTADAPLDMRMDPSAEVSAAGIVNEAAETGPRDYFQALRRGTVCAADREGDRPAQEGGAVPEDGRPRRDDQGGDSCSCPLWRRSSAKRVFQALRIASTTSSALSRPRCRQRSRCSGPVAGSR